ncbi:MAG: hypothetical protein M3179_11100 [Actinomycetota bacterium]|nr:hypothetical protein [Actinomycetota bacterium]
MTLVFVVGGLTLMGPAGAVVFSNPTPIQAEIAFSCEPYKTTPLYPSPITVSGLAGTVTDVNVTLHDFAAQVRAGEVRSFGYADDADILLEAPNGTNVMLMSDVGGNSGPAVNLSGVDITIDDSAPTNLPADTPFTSNTSVTGKPTDDDDDTETTTVEAPDAFHNTLACEPPEGLPEDVPHEPDNYAFAGPTPSSNTTLAAFNGIDPNGTWKLWMVDDYGGTQIVALDGGWSIDITVSGPSLCSKPTITGTPGVDHLVGTDGPDVIVGLGGNDMIDGRGGDDEICGGDGNDSIAGGYGNDTISGGEGGDRLSGGWGNDTLHGDGGDDFLAGGTNTDTCAGGTGLNRFSGCETQTS